MAEKINDGGPVFPFEIGTISKGITLREYFAGQVISQIIASCANDTTHGMTKADYFAGRAYEIADAMLKARGQQ